jgi:hypothetical protein
MPLPHPTCHLTYIPRPAPLGAPSACAVWVCEYPYRTMRLHGPSAECGDCPVYQDLFRARQKSGTDGLLEAGGEPAASV